MNDSDSTDLLALRGRIDDVLAVADADSVNVAYATLRLVDRASDKDRPVLLRHLAERWDGRSSSEELRLPRLISANDLTDLRDRYGELVDSALNILIKDNPEVELFYKELDALMRNPMLKSEDSRAFALYWILNDKKIPYFKLDKGLRLSQEDWTSLGQKLRMQRAKIRFILVTDFEQRSEEADLLLKELDAVDHLERVRLMGTLLWELREFETRLKAATLK